MTESSPRIRQILKRDGRLVPYDRDRIATAIFKASAEVGQRDRSRAEEAAAEVERTLLAAYGPDATPTVEDIQDLVEETLMRRGDTTVARAYIIYRHRRAQARAQRAAEPFESTDNIPYKKIYEVLRWNMDRGCETVAGLNRIIAEGQFAKLIADSEQRYTDEVAAAARQILDRGEAVRLVIIAGPSSSGKTTTTIKISEALQAAGRELVAINIDHYFFDLGQHPRDEFGDYDYETPQALDLKLINQHLAELLEGRLIQTPNYDFKTGRRTLNAHPLQLAPHQVLLIDSLHGLYANMTASVPADHKFRLYVETLGQLRDTKGNFLRWADNRLLRRMIRDSWHRNLQPMETIAHWHYVRRSELQHIIPFIDSVDSLVNSALPYELPLLKARLFSYFPRALESFRNEARRQDAYIRAQRVYDLFQEMTAVEDDTAVPAGSLLREFIGGSTYRY